MNPVDRVLSCLDGVRPNGREKWIARCPSHKDKSPSLSIAVGDDGRVLLNCHAACPTKDVVSAMGLFFRDLFPNKGISPTRQRYSKRSLERKLATELMVLYIAINMRHDGEPIHPEDAGREELAVKRISKLFDEVYG